jgi:ABC-type Mn2+/Zn2+ transport system ATPase subunit
LSNSIRDLPIRMPSTLEDLVAAQGEPSTIEQVEIRDLHGSTDLEVSLQPGLNILYGRNGTGKTTFLHVLANIVEGDLERFTYLRFQAIRVRASSGTTLELVRKATERTNSVVASLNGEPLAEVQREGQTPEYVRSELLALFGGRPVYLPAFRSVLEAISHRRASQQLAERSQRELQRLRELELHDWERNVERSQYGPTRPNFYFRERFDTIAYKTVLCREWFGQFVPVVRFPSLGEVNEELTGEYQSAQLGLAQSDRAAFSEVFVEVLRTVFDRSSPASIEDTGTVLASIRKNLESLQGGSHHFPSVYAEIATLLREQQDAPATEEAIASRILKLYDIALQERIRAQREAFRRIQTFEGSVNRFLQGKRLSINLNEPQPAHVRRLARVRLEDGREANLSVLSSGERHVLTLLFSATHMSAAEGMLLIDEPELSLHVDWQRIILEELMQQAGDRQIVACTHAPEVTADHREKMVKLNPRPHVPIQTEAFGVVPVSVEGPQ